MVTKQQCGLKRTQLQEYKRCQSTHQVIMVRPHQFQVNQQTLVDNAFQRNSQSDEKTIKNSAYMEVTQAVAILRSHGIHVKLFEDTSLKTPDSVFPNNWFTTHHDGSLILYPMLTQNRRLERKRSIIQYLENRPQYVRTIDLSYNETEGHILEGTGVMIFDHMNDCFYVARSRRTSDTLIEKLATTLGISPIVFDSEDEYGTPIYHTNVIMALGSNFVVICLDVIKDATTRERLLDSFKNTNKEVINISWQQAKHFCGNVLELQGKRGKILALSTTAYSALSEMQKHRLSQHVFLQPIHIPTIEQAGGSIRCMIAELF
ncbi:arginine deiminase-related protein [Vibrio sp.]|nr:arginine deiminase-related protein [Vibrio sp.]